MNAIILRDVSKSFRKNTIRREYSTMKSELVQFFRRGKRPNEVRTIDALKGVSFEVPRGKVFGLIGRNGSGKSTLLKIITGIYAPSSGTLEVNGRISALLELGAGFHPEFSGRENILINGIILGMSRREIRERMDQIIEFSELGDFIDEPVRTYSSGMYMRLAFSIATHVDPEILIIDEILAVGDEHFGRKSLAKMNEFRTNGKTIFLVTHDLGTIQKWCDRAAWLDGGVIRAIGEPAEVVRAYKSAVAEFETTLEQKQATPPAAKSIKAEPVQPESGPPAEPGKRWGNFLGEVSGAEVLGSNGRPVEECTPDDALTFRMHYRFKGEVGEPIFTVVIIRADGMALWETKVTANELGRSLAREGTIDLRIDRLGLCDGDYRFDLSVVRDGAILDFHKALYGFRVVSGQPPVLGLVKLAHRWSAQQPQSAGRSLTVAG
jgi:lipopolysaccharide transport system ATP-binding protein